MQRKIILFFILKLGIKIELSCRNEEIENICDKIQKENSKIIVSNSQYNELNQEISNKKQKIDDYMKDLENFLLEIDEEIKKLKLEIRELDEYFQLAPKELKMVQELEKIIKNESNKDNPSALKKLDKLLQTQRKSQNYNKLVKNTLKSLDQMNIKITKKDNKKEQKKFNELAMNLEKQDKQFGCYNEIVKE